jgi:hypothetical protein
MAAGLLSGTTRLLSGKSLFGTGTVGCKNRCALMESRGGTMLLTDK